MSITEDITTIKHNSESLSTSPQWSDSDAVQPALQDSLHASSESAELWRENIATEVLEAAMPRLVTRGPHMVPPSPLPPQKTKLDTLRITAEESVNIMKELVVLSCPDVIFIPRKNGLNGYTKAYNIVLYGQELGTLCHCAPHNERQNERPQLEIGGNGKCQKINWNIFYHYLQQLTKPSIKQVHICLDMFKGELTIEDVEQAHKDLKFQSKKASKNPLITPYGTIQPDGRNPGRSRYIGSMQSSKFIRFYEKAYEVFKGPLQRENENYESQLVKAMFKSDDPFIIEGYNDDKPIDLRKWLRAEIELKDGNCVIPLDVVVDCDKYFAGAYPFCEELLQMTDGKQPLRLKNNHDLEFEKRRLNHKAITGSFIDDCIYMGYSNDEIVNMLKGGKGPSQKLIKSGILAPQDE